MTNVMQQARFLNKRKRLSLYSAHVAKKVVHRAVLSKREQ